MDEAKYAEMRRKTVAHWAGANVAALTSPEDLLGSWEMRFTGPAGGPEIQGRYVFSSDGQVIVGEDERWQWELGPDGTLTFRIPTAPMPGMPGLEDGAITDEVMHAFKTADGPVVLSNNDTSVIETLSRSVE